MTTESTSEQLEKYAKRLDEYERQGGLTAHDWERKQDCREGAAFLRSQAARHPVADQEQGGDDLLSRIQQQLKHGNTSAKIAPPFQSVQSLQVLRAIQNDEVFVISRERLEEVECELRWSKHLAAENAELKARCERLATERDAMELACVEARGLIGEADADGQISLASVNALRSLLWRVKVRQDIAARAALAPPAQPTEEETK